MKGSQLSHCNRAVLAVCLAAMPASGCAMVTSRSLALPPGRAETVAFLSRLLEEPNRDKLKERIRATKFVDNRGGPPKRAWVALFSGPTDTWTPERVAFVWKFPHAPYTPVHVSRRLHEPGVFVTTPRMSDGWELDPGEVLRLGTDLTRVDTGGCLALGLIGKVVVCAYTPREGVTIRAFTALDGMPRLVRDPSVTAFPLRATVPTGDPLGEETEHRAWRRLTRRLWLGTLFRAGIAVPWDYFEGRKRERPAGAPPWLLRQRWVPFHPRHVIDAGSSPEDVRLLEAGRIGLWTSEDIQIWRVAPGDGEIERLDRTPLPLDRRKQRWWPVLIGEGTFPTLDLRNGLGSVSLVELRSGRVTRSFPAPKGWLVSHDLVTARDGQIIAWTEQQWGYYATAFRCRVVEVASGKSFVDMKVPLIAPGLEQLSTETITHDASLMAFGGSAWLPVAGVLDVAHKRVLWHKDLDEAVCCMVFSPDAKRLFVGDSRGGVTCYEAETGKVIWSDLENQHWLSEVDVSPDGRIVAAGCPLKCSILLWNAASGRRLRALKVWKWGDAESVRFSHDGRGLWLQYGDTRLQYVPLRGLRSDSP